ncbi:VOC family protein [Streptomyces sp. ME19-01-6]|uniref:VOC family protein n=1 Tax=Streptomyces sp. ME19-01-6 TaxID=3028686 RepID=UPI0029AB5C4E|nr:VOC family protein [Streptomyces sp. ME19-01-6]MDX3229194.1 4a-hydroxytetrahydrobiopterin dehydratase [Streptomyces sp. ME19-01-6]
METLGTQEILGAIAAGLGDWRKLAQPLAARYRVADTASGAEFVSAVAKAAVAAGQEPEIRLGRGFVDVAVSTVDADTGGRWVTTQDVELARAITGLARERGLTAVPSEVAQLELALDTADETAVAPFWSALLTGGTSRTVSDAVLDVLDPTNRVPSVWFQGTDAHQTPCQRWHIDLWLAPEVADERIAAAVAAGGTVVDDTHAPSYTVLADPDGNKVCVCTALDRD